MTKKKEPPTLPLHIEVPDDKGGTKWYTGKVALTDAVVKELKKAIGPVPHDYTAQKLTAWEGLQTWGYQTANLTLKFNNERRSCNLSECRVIHPDDWTEMKAKLDLIEKLEKGD